MLTVLSLGAGVQSSTLALMAAAGEITPMPNVAIFADTKAEPEAVYVWLDFLIKQLPFPVQKVSVGNLREEILGGMVGKNRIDARPPFFTARGGMLHRQCTQDYKIDPIHRELRKLLGLKFRQRWPKEVRINQWIGISVDEVQRMKPSRISAVQNCYPLVRRRISRSGCIQWLKKHGFPIPPKSACVFCPYHDDVMWQEMKQNSPKDFARAVEIDRAIRPGIGKENLKDCNWFLHDSRQPLDQVVFKNTRRVPVGFFFGNECEGMCGV